LCAEYGQQVPLTKAMILFSPLPQTGAGLADRGLVRRWHFWKVS
jgi:hypothetical protein